MGQATATGAASGAASGAAMGAMLAPGTMGMSIPIGMAVGGLAGALGGMGQDKAAKAQAAALAEQQWAMRREMIARAKGVGATREKFGDISQWGQKFNGGSNFFTKQHNPAKFQDIGKTLQNRSALEGGIEQQAAAVRDAGRADLNTAAQQGAVGMRGSLADRGLLGSSLDTAARQSLLASYAGGKSNLANATAGTRQAGWSGVQNTQNAFENAAQGGANIQGQLGALSAAGSIAGARQQMPVTMFGNMLNAGMGLANYGALAQAQGGQGVTAFGLPKMNLPGNKVAGASTSKGY